MYAWIFEKESKKKSLCMLSPHLADWYTETAFDKAR